MSYDPPENHHSSYMYSLYLVYHHQNKPVVNDCVLTFIAISENFNQNFLYWRPYFAFYFSRL